MWDPGLRHFLECPVRHSRSSFPCWVEMLLMLLKHGPIFKCYRGHMWLRDKGFLASRRCWLVPSLGVHAWGPIQVP